MELATRSARRERPLRDHNLGFGLMQLYRLHALDFVSTRPQHPLGDRSLLEISLEKLLVVLRRGKCHIGRLLD